MCENILTFSFTLGVDGQDGDLCGGETAQKKTLEAGQAHPSEWNGLRQMRTSQKRYIPCVVMHMLDHENK